MPESLPMKTRLLLAGASLQLISLAKKSEKKEKKQKSRCCFRRNDPV